MTSRYSSSRYSSKNGSASHPGFGEITPTNRVLGNLFKGQAAIAAVLPEKYSAQAASLNATVSVVSPEVVLSQCPLCNNRHCRSQCTDFRSKSLEEQMKITRAKGLCNKYRVTGHVVRRIVFVK